LLTAQLLGGPATKQLTLSVYKLSSCGFWNEERRVRLSPVSADETGKLATSLPVSACLLFLLATLVRRLRPVLELSRGQCMIASELVLTW
jgi:hypothetical protein